MEKEKESFNNLILEIENDDDEYNSDQISSNITISEHLRNL